MSDKSRAIHRCSNCGYELNHGYGPLYYCGFSRCSSHLFATFVAEAPAPTRRDEDDIVIHGDLAHMRRDFPDLDQAIKASPDNGDWVKKTDNDTWCWGVRWEDGEIHEVRGVPLPCDDMTRWMKAALAKGN